MNGKVTIGYPRGETVRGEFCDALVATIAEDNRKGRRIEGIIPSAGLYVAHNRNEIVRAFLKRDSEWLWMLDSDIVFALQTLEGLLAVADAGSKSVVSALYFTTIGELFTFCWLKRGADGRYRTLPAVTPGPQGIDATGMGCCLIHRSVLAEMATRRKGFGPRWFAHDLANYTGDDGEPEWLGEDVSFCRRVQALGGRIWGHGGVVVEHIKSRRENVATYLERQIAMQAIKDGTSQSALAE